MTSSWVSRIRVIVKHLNLAVVGMVAVLLTSAALANPVLDNVAAGNVSVQQSPGTTVVNQSTQKAIINWQSFNIGQGESTHFNQPAGGVALNRISPTQGASQIYGSLTATGQIILINPAGIYFGPSAYVNVGGIVASTANISDQNFMNNIYQFSKVNGYSGAIVNEGQIIAAQHGLVALVAPGIINKGMIQANLGKVVLASGEAFTLNFSGDNLINFAIDMKTSARGVDKDGNSLSDGVNNTGSIYADGGTIMLSANAVSGVLDHTINMENIAQARSIYENQGQIIISGDKDSGIVRVAGNLDASGKNAGESGGNVTITGYNILLDSPSIIDVSGDTGGGDVLVGGNYQGKGPLPNANATVMAPGATILANAITTGNGGNVILWSDNVTKFYGDISAKGGTVSGDGGLVETSGKIYLDSLGSVNASALFGKSGTWLLDPADINITTSQSNGGFNGGSPNIFTATANSATVDVANINASLNLGTSVIIQTSGCASCTQPGDISVNGIISKTAGGNASLTLNADRDINLFGGTTTLISSTSGALNVYLNASNTITLGANISTNGGEIQFNAPVKINFSNRTLNTNGGNVLFSSYAGSVGAARDLIINAGSGNITFNGNLGVGSGLNQTKSTTLNSTGVTTLNGSDNQMSLLTTNAGGSTIINGNITVSGTTGDMSFYDAVTLTNNVILTTGSSRPVLFNSTLNGAYNLTINSNSTVTFNGLIGGVTPLSSIDVTSVGNTFLNSSITTTGLQRFHSPVILGANATLNTTNSSVTFDSSIDRDSTARSLTINAGSGAITLSGNIGSGVNGALGDLAFNSTGTSTLTGTINAATLVTNTGGSTIIGNNITTSGLQTYNDAVTLGGNATLYSSGGSNITFASTLNGGSNLIVNTAGITAFNNVVGGTTALTSITTDAGGSTTTNGNISTTGSQTYNDAVTLGANSVFSSSSSGNITFGSTLNSSGSARTFTVNTTGITTFGSTVGNTLALSSLTTNAGGSTSLNGDIKTINNQTYNDAVTLGADTTLTTTGANRGIIFTNPIAWSGSQILSLVTNTTSGTITLPSSITASNGTLNLTAANTASSINAASTAVDIGTFNLIRGQWIQNSSVLPSFSATDFKTNNGSGISANLQFLRVTGGNGSAGSPYQIADIYGLQGIGSGTALRGFSYILTNNINAASTINWNSGAGFAPIGGIGSSTQWFTGSINGGNHTIDQLTINNPSMSTIGLIRRTSGATISNLNLTNLSLSGGSNQGGIVGFADSTTSLNNVSVTGTITNTNGSSSVGGLVGQNAGTISNSSANVNMSFTTGTLQAGGLVGLNTSTGSISNSYSLGTLVINAATPTAHFGGIVGYNSGAISNAHSSMTITATNVGQVGGLAGSNTSTGTITDSYFNGSASLNGGYFLGGLTGQNDGSINRSFNMGSLVASGGIGSFGGIAGYNTGSISQSYNIASLTAQPAHHIGGIVGYNDGGTISNAYNTGTITATSINGSGDNASYNIGGAVGVNNAGAISNVYSIGRITADANSHDIGGLVGVVGTGTTSNSYWDTQTSGQTTSAAGYGKTTAQMQTQSTFSGWDFSTIWNIVEGQSYPFLRAFYSTAPRIISGSTAAAAGTQVTIAANGTIVDTAYTSANGSYYFLAGNNLISGINSSIADGAAILTYLNSGSMVGNAVTLAPTSGGSISGLNITSNGLLLGSNNVATLSNTTLSIALGALSGSKYLYSISGGNLIIGNSTHQNVAFSTSANTTYNLNSSISPTSGATNSSITFNGAVAANANVSLTATAISFLNSLTSTGNINITGANSNNSLTMKTANAQVFGITSADAGTVTGLAGYTGTLSFNNIQNLIGGDNGNTFNFSDNATLSGSINGSNLSKTNTLNMTAYSQALKIILSSTNDGVIRNMSDNTVTGFSNITNVNMNNAYSNSIQTPSGKGNSVYITGGRIGYINDPIYFNGVNTFIGSSGSSVNFLTNATYDPATNLFSVNGLTMSFSNFASYTGYTISSPSLAVSNIVQQPPTNAEQAASTTVTTSSSWVLAGTSVDQNITTIVADVTNQIDDNLQSVKINPYCYSTQ